MLLMKTISFLLLKIRKCIIYEVVISFEKFNCGAAGGRKQSLGFARQLMKSKITSC